MKTGFSILGYPYKLIIFLTTVVTLQFFAFLTLSTHYQTVPRIEENINILKKRKFKMASNVHQRAEIGDVFCAQRAFIKGEQVAFMRYSETTGDWYG